MLARHLRRLRLAAAAILLTLAAAACIQPGPGAPVDSPDPSVLRVGQTSYLYSTSTVLSSQRYNVPVWSSTDQHTWRFRGEAFPATAFPSWASTAQTWAPSVMQRSDGKFVLYVSPWAPGLNHHAVAAAVASSPVGPFDGRGIAPVQASGAANDTSRGAIDPSPVTYGGAPYLLWKSDVWPPSPAHPARLLARRLRPDGLAYAAGSPEVVLLTGHAGWQGFIVEGPSMLPTARGAILFYSGNFYASTAYATGWARCPAGPTAPCTDATPSKALVATSGKLLGPGGAEVVRGPGAAELAYHGWTNGSANYAPWGTATRRLWISSLAVDAGGVPHLS